MTGSVETPRGRQLASRVVKVVLVGAIGLLVLVGAAGIYAALQLRGFEQVEFDPETSRDRLPGTVDDTIERRDELLTFLILGSDAREGFGGARADVIMLVVVPPDDEPPILASIPRDLWIDNPCTGGKTRANAGLNGCGAEVSGPQLMTVMIEDLAQLEIDHYAEVDFEGFTRIVDHLGGTEICTDHPVRDHRAGLDLPGGCVDADGEQALAWVRSRSTQEQVDGEWRTMDGVDDLTRNERQQDLMLAILRDVNATASPRALTSIIGDLSDAVVLDSGMSTRTGVNTALELRGVDLDDARRVTIPVTHHTTSGGAAVLLPEADLAELLRAELGDHAPEDAGTAP